LSRPDQKGRTDARAFHSTLPAWRLVNWDRLPLITPRIEARLYAAITAKCKELKCELIAIGGIEDHVLTCW